MSTTLDPPAPHLAKAPDRSQDQPPPGLFEQIDQPRFWRDKSLPTATGKDDWSVLSRHLAHRPAALNKLWSAKNSPLRWGLTPDALAPRSEQFLTRLEKVGRGKQGWSATRATEIEPELIAWLKLARSLSAAPNRTPTLDFGWECLAVAHALPNLAPSMGQKFWWELLDALWQITHTASNWRCDVELPPEQGVAQQLFAGELPLTLAYLFPAIRPIYKLRTAAYESLNEGFRELLNGQGLLPGRYLPYLRPLLAAWTRCRTLGADWYQQGAKKGVWNRPAEEQFRQLATHALALSSPRGTALLGHPHDAPWSADFLAQLLRLCQDTTNISTARTLFKKKITRGLPAKQVARVPETSENCEWSGVAYLRSRWQRSGHTVAIDYSTPDLRLEAWAGTQRLLAGTWSWETTLDGQRLEPADSWEEICWFSDDDVDYLELSIDLSQGARLERQILLARQDQFLLLADNVMRAPTGQICHRYRLPLDEEVSFQPEQETREGLLWTTKPVARVLPLALPEWRADPRVGQLLTTQQHLQLEQEMTGTNVACPLLVDLKKSRSDKPCTWRQLTVAQSLEIQPPDVAVGYRAQCGKQQWLLYRSLAERANRSLLGQNVSLECLVARFLPAAGEVEELLEIE